jgi:GNAT superfamily N-acetyltransferase
VAQPLEFRIYSPADAGRVLNLLQTSFGAWPGRRVVAHDRPAEFLRWKHERNPHGPSFILLAEADGRLVGMRAYMPWPLAAGGEEVGAVQAVDLATHPDYRGRGVSSELTMRARETLRETTAFSLGLPNELSRSQSRKVGWEPVGALPLWVRVRRPLRVARRARALRSAGRALAVPSADAAPVAELLVDHGAVAGLLADARAAEPRFATRCDVDYLSWRYEPQLGDYRAVVEHRAGALTGMAIFGLRQRGELWEASICELLVRPGDHRTVARLLRQVIRAAPVDYLAAVPAAGSSQARALARAGFVRSPFGARALGVSPYRERIEPDPRLSSSWSLSFGDLERLQLC